jgi:transcriptional regulator with XRE-family HTH domain
MSNDLDPRLTPGQRFGRELARARKNANLTQAALGRRLGCSPSLVAHIEKGDRTPKPDLAARCDQIFATGEFFTRLCRNITAPIGPGWFIRWTDEIEPHARVLRSWDPLHIPGLLQTRAYAEAIFRGGLFESERDIEEKVEARIRRQIILRRDRPPDLLLLMDEGVLRRPIGGPSVMVEQLESLLTVPGCPHVTMQVVPCDSSCTTGLMSAFTIAELPDGPTAVSVDSALRAVVTTDHEDVSLIWRCYDKLRIEALRPSSSLEIIEKALDEWKQQT